jgi:hypothetical protein
MYSPLFVECTLHKLTLVTSALECLHMMRAAFLQSLFEEDLRATLNTEFKKRTGFGKGTSSRYMQ